MENQELSFGERLVRTSFNPDDNSVVQNIKERFAEVANYIDENVAEDIQRTSEILRLKARAFDAIEAASLFAVKAATTNIGNVPSIEPLAPTADVPVEQPASGDVPIDVITTSQEANASPAIPDADGSAVPQPEVNY